MKFLMLCIIVGMLCGSTFPAAIAYWMSVSHPVRAAWHPTTDRLRDQLLERLDLMDAQEAALRTDVELSRNAERRAP